MKKMPLLAGLLLVVFLSNSIVPVYVSAQSPVRITNTPSLGSNPTVFITYKGRLYFSAKSATDGAELYSTDGTPGGTSLLKNINTTPGKGSDPTGLIVFNDKLYFGAHDATGGKVWVTDGTSGGTTLFKDLGLDMAGDPQKLRVANNRVYFIDRNTSSGRLWISDGTPAGTKRLSDALGGINVGNDVPYSLRAVGNKLFYGTRDKSELWVTDGTVAGTSFLKGGPDPKYPALLFFEAGTLSQFTEFNGKLMFRAYAQTSTGDEPWISDGTPEGTYSLDLTPGATPSIVGEYRYYSGKMYFPFKGLWETDGTKAGSKQIKDVPNPQSLRIFNNKLYFAANLNELWTSDGNTSGTKLVKKLDTGRIDQLLVVGDKLYFSAYVGDYYSKRELWQSDGTDAGTYRVSLFNPYAADVFGSVQWLINADDQLYFIARSSGLASPELYRLQPNQPPAAAAVANVTGTVGKPFHQVIPGFKDPEGLPLFYAVKGLPAKLMFSGGGGGIVAGTPITAGVFSVTVTARDISGLSVSTTYTLTINPPSGSAFALQAPAYNCQTGAITFKTSGGNGSLIEYQAAGITSWSTNPNQFVDKGLITANDVKPFTLQARQSEIVVSFIWDMKAYCAKSPLP